MRLAVWAELNFAGTWQIWISTPDGIVHGTDPLLLSGLSDLAAQTRWNLRGKPR